MVRGLKFRIKDEEGLYYVAKTKVLISCAVTAQLICAFVFAYANGRFSRDMAHSCVGSSFRSKPCTGNTGYACQSELACILTFCISVMIP